MGLASRVRQSWSKNRKRPHFASLSQANPSPESKIFLKIEPRSLPAYVEGLNNSLAIASYNQKTESQHIGSGGR